MSINNMREIRNALWNADWRLLAELGDDRYSPKIYEPDDMLFCWGIKHEHTGKELELEFFANDFLGCFSKNPKDIISCTISAINYELFFDKVKSKTWKENLKKFIYKISDMK